MTARGQTVTPLRTAHIMAQVVKVENVFDDPAALLAILEKRAPHNLIYGKQGYEKSGGAEPWFRDNWMIEGDVRVPEALDYLYNEKLIAGAKEAFGASVIRPRSMIWNITLPMLAGRPHFDLSPYRGLDHNTPYWLHVLIHNSQLFIPWAVPSTTALVLFYCGEQGGFEYWPDGPQAPSKQELPPFWNMALATDNEFMFHRPMAIGRPEQRLRPASFGGEAKLHRDADGKRWRIVDDHGERAVFDAVDVRYSLVWKALAFRDATAAAIYDNHADDLTLDIIWGVFAEDLRARKLPFQVPHDPLTDREFRAAILAAYPNPGQSYFADAKYR